MPKKSDKQKAATGKRLSREEEFWQRMRIGGMKVMRQSGGAELFEVSGPNRERSSAAGSKTIVGPILDPRLGLTVQQRAVAQTYGAYFEDVTTGGSSEWLQEFVDKGPVTGSSVSEAKMNRLAMVTLAREAALRCPPGRYPLRKPKGSRPANKPGPHKPIKAIRIIDMVCVGGLSMTVVATRYGWTVIREGRTVVPDRQRKAATLYLGQVLDFIGETWHSRGLWTPAGIASVDSE